MPRRRSKTGADQIADDIYEGLMYAPTWAGPVLAVVAFLVVRFIFPLILAPLGREMGSPLATLSRNIAPFAAVFVLVIWIVAEFKKRSRRELLDSKSDIESIRDLSWQEFEWLVGEAYRRQGFLVEETGGGGADGGVDLRLRRRDEFVLVQCKQWKSWKVGVKVVRELFGVMTAERATSAVVVTCGRFTQDALRFADGKPLALINGDGLWEMVKDVQATSHPKASLPASRVADSGPPADVRITAPMCPRCGSAMVLRTTRKGANAGSQFFGCSGYPACRGIVNLDSR